MRIGLVLLPLLALLLAVPSAGAGEQSLLSNNIKAGAFTPDFPEGTKILATAMKHSFVSEGEFATDAEAAKTGGENHLFDGNAGTNWKSRAYSKWGGGQWITLNLDFGAKYAITQVDVWALHEATRDTESVQLLFSKDGKEYVPQASAKIADDVEKKKDFFAKIPVVLAEPVLAQYVQIRIRRLASAKQQQIAEVAVWGRQPEAGTALREAGARPKIAFGAEPIQSGALLVTWEEGAQLAEGVKEWRLYRGKTAFTDIRQEGVQLVKSVKGAERRTALYPLTPGEDFFFSADRSL